MIDKLNDFYGIMDSVLDKNKIYILIMSRKIWKTETKIIKTKTKKICYTFDINPRVLHYCSLKNAVSRDMSSNFQNRCFEDEKCKS